MRVRRDVSSIPHRSAGETWQKIIDLISGPKSRDVQQLKDAAGVIASIITDEHPAARSLIVEGVGPQLLIYCRYGMKAVQEGGKVDPLTWNPTAGDWEMHVPCDRENIDWVKASLAETSPRIHVFDVDEVNRAEEESQRSATKDGKELIVDWNIGG